MSVTVWSFDLAIRDSEKVLGAKEVFILPKGNDPPRRLNTTEAQHALAFIGMVPSQVEIKPEEGRSLRTLKSLQRSDKVRQIVEVIHEIDQPITYSEILNLVNSEQDKGKRLPKGTISSILNYLTVQKCVEFDNERPRRYQISELGQQTFQLSERHV